MFTIIRLALVFIIGASFGWINELIFRRIVYKKWVNPGFLVGPCLPLYGIGLVILFLLSSIRFDLIVSTFWQKFITILLITLSLTMIELLTGLIFIKKLDLKLWDYSNRLFNIEGIICPTFSLIWVFFGLIYYFFIHQYIKIASNWIIDNLVYSFFIGIYIGIFIVDQIYSFLSLKKKRTKIKNWHYNA